MNFLGKITGFTISFSDWVSAGCPMRDPEHVREIFETHCNPPDGPCDKYEPDSKNIPIVGSSGVCGMCGCHVSPNPDDRLNMLNYPTKPCGLGKFTESVDKPLDTG